MKKFGIDEFLEKDDYKIASKHPFDKLTEIDSGDVKGIICYLPIPQGYAVLETTHQADIYLSLRMDWILEQIKPYTDLIHEQYLGRVSIHFDIRYSSRSFLWKIQPSLGFKFVEDFDEFQVMAKLMTA